MCFHYSTCFVTPRRNPELYSRYPTVCFIWLFFAQATKRKPERVEGSQQMWLFVMWIRLKIHRWMFLPTSESFICSCGFFNNEDNNSNDPTLLSSFLVCLLRPFSSRNNILYSLMRHNTGLSICLNETSLFPLFRIKNKVDRTEWIYQITGICNVEIF